MFPLRAELLQLGQGRELVKALDEELRQARAMCVLVCVFRAGDC